MTLGLSPRKFIWMLWIQTCHIGTSVPAQTLVLNSCMLVWRAQPSLSAHEGHYSMSAKRTKLKHNCVRNYHGNYHCRRTEARLNFSQTWSHSGFWCTRRWKYKHKSHLLATSSPQAEGRLFPPKFKTHKNQFKAKGLILLEDERDHTPPRYLPLLFTNLLRSVPGQGAIWLSIACQVQLCTCLKAHQIICVAKT